MIRLMQGDCLERMKEIESGSVDAIICDPPYGTIKGAPKNWGNGDKGEKQAQWDSKINTKLMLDECNRILRKNGALILFCQEPYTSHLITNAHKNVPFSYRLTWLKDNFANALGVNKAPVSYTEDVCVFFKKNLKCDFDCNNPIHSYAMMILKDIGKSRSEIFKDFEGLGLKKYAAMHFFLGKNSQQFTICTKETYSALSGLYSIDKIDYFIEYDELERLSKEYTERNRRELLEKFPKVFNLPKGAKYKSNVLQYRKDYTGHHPTQKPVAIMEDLIRTYTNEGETVLDFTMGSGSTGVAAKKSGRKFIGIELDEGYFEISQKRIDEA